MQEPFHAQRLKLPQQLGRAQGLGHGAHQVELDMDRQGRRGRREVSHTLHTPRGRTWTDDGEQEHRRTLLTPPRMAQCLLPSARGAPEPAACFAGDFREQKEGTESLRGEMSEKSQVPQKSRGAKEKSFREGWTHGERQEEQRETTAHESGVSASLCFIFRKAHV